MSIALGETQRGDQHVVVDVQFAVLRALQEIGGAFRVEREEALIELGEVG